MVCLVVIVVGLLSVWCSWEISVCNVFIVFVGGLLFYRFLMRMVGGIGCPLVSVSWVTSARNWMLLILIGVLFMMILSGLRIFICMVLFC